MEPRPSWLPADAPWPPASFSTAPPDVPLTTDAPLSAPAPGAVPWANAYSDVIASSTATRGYNYAGFWIRVVAVIIDTLIVGVPFAVVEGVIFYGNGGGTAGFAQLQAVNSVLRLVSFAVQLGYFVYFWSLGSTPGMRIVGIRVADQTTFESIGLGQAALRYVGWLVSSFCCLIGFIWAAFDGRKQGWHDKIGGTVVLWR